MSTQERYIPVNNGGVRHIYMDGSTLKADLLNAKTGEKNSNNSWHYSISPTYQEVLIKLYNKNLIPKDFLENHKEKKIKSIFELPDDQIISLLIFYVYLY